MLSLRKISLAFLLLIVLGKANAGYFDCSVVYDEFENLMNKRFLMEPDAFGPTFAGGISKQQFETQQKGQFKLFPNRVEMGIGILKTNSNIHSKFLYRWGAPMVDGSFNLVFDEIVRYARVSDGYAPSRIGPVVMKPGSEIDIDNNTVFFGNTQSQEIGQGDGESQQRTDLRYRVDPNSGMWILEAINGASVHFPLETLCHTVSN